MLGIIWTAVTAAVMFALAAGKAAPARRWANPVLRTEGRVMMIDAILAAAVLLGLALNAVLGWWWADPPLDTCCAVSPEAAFTAAGVLGHGTDVSAQDPERRAMT